MTHSTDTYRAALSMVRQFGFVDAVARCERVRNMSSEGTASFASHNAVLKELRLMATVGRLNQPEVGMAELCAILPRESIQAPQR